jgi:hypothetical protein
VTWARAWAFLSEGYGYADRDDRTSPELLREGQRVEFTTEESAKGPRAGEVRLVEG